MEENLHGSHSLQPSSSSSSSEEEEEEDYINMEVDHPCLTSSIFSHSSNKEFEFQSFSSSSDRDHTTTSPADELFYMGKLLPLHLPPRLEMVHKILQNTSSFDSKTAERFVFEDESFSTPLFTPTSNTPFESCNISPVESCQASRELSRDEYLVEYLSTEKKSWTKKLKMIKQSSGVGSKMKWTSYLKSLFTRSSGCSDEHSAAADQRQLSKTRQCGGGDCKTAAKNSAPFGQIKYNRDSSLVGDNRGGRHRRSFSGAFKRLSKPKTSASSTFSSANLNRNVFKRSISSSSEIESPIQAAIAHCKRSQNSRQIADEVAFCPISASSRVACDDQESARLCRG